MDITIQLAHGSGGKESGKLIKDEILKVLGNPRLNKLEDAAEIILSSKRIAFTTDSYVVSPHFFPGGDIGYLAVCGTVNDLAVKGAVPVALSLGLIIEEGLPMADLKKILRSIKKASDEAGVEIITGDTKVVNKGMADKIYINTAGVGEMRSGVDLSMDKIKLGDAVIVSGYLGDHGTAIMLEREGINIKAPIKSDASPLNGMIGFLLEGSEGSTNLAKDVAFMRDLTRGGLATCVNEISARTGLNVEVEEATVPVREPVKACAEMLGLDPMVIANEGKILIVCRNKSAGKVLDILRSHKFGKNAARIGEISATGNSSKKGLAILITPYGGKRILEDLTGEILPRIC